MGDPRIHPNLVCSSRPCRVTCRCFPRNALLMSISLMVCILLAAQRKQTVHRTTHLTTLQLQPLVRCCWMQRMACALKSQTSVEFFVLPAFSGGTLDQEHRLDKVGPHSHYYDGRASRTSVLKFFSKHPTVMNWSNQIINPNIQDDRKIKQTDHQDLGPEGCFKVALWIPFDDL